MITPPCHACGSVDRVFLYREEQPETTICYQCCETAEHPDGETGHQFEYEPGEGHMCVYCGIRRSDTDWEPADDYD